VREASGDRAAYSVNWLGASIVPATDDLTVAVEGLKPARQDPLEHATLFRFKDAETARAARTAMERLKAACTPQR